MIKKNRILEEIRRTIPLEMKLQLEMSVAIANRIYDILEAKGMSQKDLDHVFERFYRSDNVRNEKINGHGLGLSIAKLIIMKHSGTITVRSQLDVGTEFVITIPKFRLW